jgi:hypothetical protein
MLSPTFDAVLRPARHRHLLVLLFCGFFFLLSFIFLVFCRSFGILPLVCFVGCYLSVLKHFDLIVETFVTKFTLVSIFPVVSTLDYDNEYSASASTLSGGCY